MLLILEGRTGKIRGPPNKMNFAPPFSRWSLLCHIIFRRLRFCPSFALSIYFRGSGSSLDVKALEVLFQLFSVKSNTE